MTLHRLGSWVPGSQNDNQVPIHDDGHLAVLDLVTLLSAFRDDLDHIDS